MCMLGVHRVQKSLKKKKKQTLRRVQFSSQVQVIIHYSWEVTVAGTQGSWSHRIRNQDERAPNAYTIVLTLLPLLVGSRIPCLGNGGTHSGWLFPLLLATSLQTARSRRSLSVNSSQVTVLSSQLKTNQLSGVFYLSRHLTFTPQKSVVFYKRYLTFFLSQISDTVIITVIQRNLGGGGLCILKVSGNSPSLIGSQGQEPVQRPQRNDTYWLAQLTF